MVIDRLIGKIIEMKNPTAVGLDPRLDYIPDHIKEKAFSGHGKTLRGASTAFLNFNKEIIDAVYDLVPAVKPQIAMYEQFGACGIEAYIETVKYAKTKGLVVIGDIKRSDIASTAEAYSDGHIGEVLIGSAAQPVYDVDFITLNPYLGTDSITPFLDNCEKYDKGLFVLIKTSNHGSGVIQNLETPDGKIYEHIARLTEEWGKPFIGKYGFSSIGGVVGATHRKQAEEIRAAAKNVFFLIPGYGAQGGQAEDLAVCFNEDGIGGIVNSSRGIIAAYKLEKYKNEFKPQDFAKAARQAAIDMKNDLARCIKC